MSNKDDLVTLIDNANQAMERGDETAHRRSRGVDFSILGKFVVLMMLPVSAITAIDEFGTETLSQPAIESKIIGVLHTAKHSLDVAMMNDRLPPPVLPNASLANIVHYDVQDNRFMLSMESHGVFVSMNENGDITTRISEFD